MHYFSPLNTLMRKGKDPDSDPYLWLKQAEFADPECNYKELGSVLFQLSYLYASHKVIDVFLHWRSRAFSRLFWLKLGLLYFREETGELANLIQEQPFLHQTVKDRKKPGG